MASNPYVNKVEFAGQTIMDISNDTVTPSDVLDGVTFHDRSGAPQTGAVITHNVYDGLDSTSTSDALSANQGKVLNSKIEPQALTVTDLNDATSPGRYKIAGTYTHAPATGIFGYMEVVKYSNTDIAQTIYKFNSTGSTIYLRRYTTNSWGSWEELALKSDTFATHTVYLNNTDAIAANTVKRFDLNTTYTGYTPLGIVEITGSGTTGLVIQEYSIDRNNSIARIYFRNVTNAAITPSQIKITILYINRIL